MVKPFVRTLIDWDGDGFFVGDYDNITDDIRSMSLTHTRQTATEYMNGAVLNFQLNNNDNKYSPPKETSPLHGKLKMGKGVKAEMWYPYDDFVDTTGTVLTSHTIPYDSEFSWTNGSGAFKCHSDGYAELNSGAYSLSVIDMGQSNLEVSAEITTSALGTTSTYESGLVLRYIDNNNYLYVRIIVSTNHIQVRKVIGGTDSLCGTGTADSQVSYTWGSGTKKKLGAEIHGDTIRLYIDDAKVYPDSGGHSGTYHGFKLDGASALDNATKHGFYTQQGATDAKFHEFGGFRPLFKGTLKEITPRPQKGMQYCYMKAYDLFEDYKLTHGYGQVNISAGTKTGSVAGRATAPLGLGTGDMILSSIDNYLTTYPTGMSPYLNAESLDGETVLETLYRVQDTEDGFLYVDGRGFLRFEERTHRNTGVHKRVVGTFKDSYDGTNAGYRQYSYNEGIDGVYNEIEIGFLTRESKTNPTSSLTAGTTAWELNEPIAISAGETQEFVAKSSVTGDTTDTLFHGIAGDTGSVTSPTSSDRVQINTASDGSGSLLAFTKTAGDYSKYGGRFASWTIRNDSASNGYITVMKTNVEVQGNNSSRGMRRVTDSDSVTLYGERKKSREHTFFTTAGDAQTCADHMLTKLKEPILRMRCDLINHDKATLMQMVHRRLSDQVDVIETDMGFSGHAYVDGYQYKFYNGNTVVEETVHLTRAGINQTTGNWNEVYWGSFGWS